jgi:hypothetical protein
MNSETKTCRNCKNPFTTEPDDFSFYEKIKVPPPTFCPECRLQRRLAWRNDLSFYNRECDLCKKKIVSLHHPDKSLTVYCNKCWWSDAWDPKRYGRDIDFSRPFFEQMRELQDAVPLPALFNDDGVGSVNCEYTQNTTFAKNCYMGALCWFAEDCMYYYSVPGPETRDVVDSLDIYNYSQIIYDSIFLEHCYNCQNAYYSTGLNDCRFVYDCKGCSNCFMCVNLRQKNYCILNKEYSKEEYERILKSYKLETYSGRERAKKEFSEFLSQQVRRFSNTLNCVNCSGDGIFNCKNTKNSFFARACEDMHFLWRGNEIKDSYDLTPAGKSSQCYEGLTPDNDSRVLFSIYSLKSQELSYVENCHSSQYLFGCSGIRHGEYCILNKQYTKEEYFDLRDRLIKHMQATGEFGEFFPISMSHFGYNETMAQEFFPLSKNEALQKGYKWWDNLQKTEGKETLKSEDIPDPIMDVSESILEQILSCVECKRNYKIVKNEFLFYKKHSIPIPRRCFYCRNSARFRFQNPYKLWHRQCMCDKDNHSHKGRCAVEFETSYAPERPEKIYCEQCYQREVY